MSMDVVHNCCSKQKVKRGLWSPEEDEKLMNHIQNCGHGSWSSIPKIAGLQRCGKSCRLRWINYLRPDLKRGSFSEQEERIIIDVHRVLGNRWAQIAKQMPGRTDNEVKNFWNSCIKKKLISQGLDPNTHVPLATISHESKTCSSSFHESSSSTTPTYVYQNPNLVWPDRFQEQTPKPLTGTFHVPTISSSSYHHSFPTELDIIIENCKNWGTGTTAITTEPTKMQLVQKQEEGCEVLQAETGTVFGYNGRQTNIDVGSFGSCNSLDFDFVESALVPCEMDYHLRPIMDQVAWHR